MKAIQVIIKIEIDDVTLTKATPWIDLEEDFRRLKIEKEFRKKTSK